MRFGNRAQQAVTFALALCVLGALLGHAARLFDLRFVSQTDAVFYDIKSRIFAPQTPDDRIVIVDIDDRSLAELGRWPWRRDLMAEIVDILFESYRIRAVGFDVVFAGSDQDPGMAVLDRVARIASENYPSMVKEIERLKPEFDRDGKFVKLAAWAAGRTGLFLLAGAARRGERAAAAGTCRLWRVPVSGCKTHQLRREFAFDPAGGRGGRALQR